MTTAAASSAVDAAGAAGTASAAVEGDGAAATSAAAVAPPPPPASAAPPPKLPTFHLDIHAWMDSQQTSHGVRHGDYAQYHAYCTRRLSRLSHKPSDAKPHLVHSAKYATAWLASPGAATHNNATATKSRGAPRHAYCGRSHDTFAPAATTKGDDDGGESESESPAAAGVGAAATPFYRVPHVNILWYLLVSAERSWAHARELQQEKKDRAAAKHQRTGGGGGGALAGGDPEDGRNRTRRRHHVLRKLKRAKDWADLLVAMAGGGNTDDGTHRECRAYQAWMSANYALERMDCEVSEIGCLLFLLP
jgi:RNA-binding signal recognition particle 68